MKRSVTIHLLALISFVSAGLACTDDTSAKVGRFNTNPFGDTATIIAYGSIGDRVSFGSIAIHNNGDAPITLDSVSLDLEEDHTRFLGVKLMGTPRPYGTTGAMYDFPPTGPAMEGFTADIDLAGAVVPVTSEGELQPYILFVGIEAIGPGPAYVERVVVRGHSGKSEVVGVYEINFAICLREDGEPFSSPTQFTDTDEANCPYS